MICHQITALQFANMLTQRLAYSPRLTFKGRFWLKMLCGGMHLLLGRQWHSLLNLQDNFTSIYMHHRTGKLLTLLEQINFSYTSLIINFLPLGHIIFCSFPLERSVSDPQWQNTNHSAPLPSSSSPPPPPPLPPTPPRYIGDWLSVLAFYPKDKLVPVQ